MTDFMKELPKHFSRYVDDEDLNVVGGYLDEAAELQLHYVCLYEYRWYMDCPRLISAASLLGLHCLSMYSLQGFK